MILLIASIAALLLGPPLLKLASNSPWALRFLDGFVYIAIGGLVLLHVLPEVVEISGWWAIGAALIGMLGPSTVERRLERSAAKAHEAALILAIVALALHGLFDGVALSGQAHLHGEIGLAVVLHRLPVGLTLWWLVRPAHGVRGASLALAVIALATVGGYALGGVAAGAMEEPAMGLLYALVAGSLLHVVLHRPHPVAQGKGRRGDATIGAAFGVALLVFLHRSHEGQDAHFWELLLDLTMESAPALLIGYAAAGLVQAFLPKATVAWMGRGSSASQAARGVAFGLPLPICSCGVVPVYRSLVVQGAPPAAAMAFLVATPELGLDAVLLSLPLLGAELTVIRVAGAAFVALAVGALVGRFATTRGTNGADNLPPAGKAEGTVVQRLRQAAEAGFGEVVDHTAPWILAGLVIAAAAAPALGGTWLTEIPPIAQVTVFTLLGMPLYVCASGATPMVAVFIAAGVSPGAGIAFLLSGPATNVTTFGILGRLHGRAVAAAFAATMAAVCIGLGMGIDLAFPDLAAGVWTAGEHEHGWVRQASLAALILVSIASLVRQGPRGFFGQVIDQGPEDAGHAHDHDHGDGHDHPGDGAPKLGVIAPASDDGCGHDHCC